MVDDIKMRAILVDDGDKDDMISKLIAEKKTIKEKNVRLASLLTLVTKKVSEMNNNQSNSLDDSKLIDMVNKMASLKKQSSSIEHMLEKSKIDSKVDELMKTLSDIDSRVETIETRLSAVHKINDIENKLNDVESLIKLHKRGGENPFGMLGNVGGDEKSSTKLSDLGKLGDASKSMSSDKGDKKVKTIKKLDKKIKASSKKSDKKEIKTVHKHSKAIEDVSNISKTMEHFVDKLYKH
ncbi:MAG: hypothetical protein GQ477_00645 [Nanohaloarchaea archaeon]|nr:hypothetical protein [Candidatus Nanohaloarchaea archaeon]